MVATRATRIAAARQRCLSNDVMGDVLGYLSPEEAWQIGAISKAWLEPRARALRGKLRMVRRVGPFGYDCGVTALDKGGVVVANYEGFRLEFFSRDGDPTKMIGSDRSQVIDTPTATAFCSDGKVWVIEKDLDTVVLMDLDSRKRFAELDKAFYASAQDLAIAGDRLLVLYHDTRFSNRFARAKGGISVYDVVTGEHRFQFGCDSPSLSLERALIRPSSLVVSGDLVYVADSRAHAIKVFNHETGAFVRKFGAATPQIDLEDWEDFEDVVNGSIEAIEKLENLRPGGFLWPFGVAVAHGRMYVSERLGRRIQVLALPDGKPLQVIESPDGEMLGRLCVDGENVWSLGPKEEMTYGHIFAPYLPDPAIAEADRRARAEAAASRQAEERLAEEAARAFVLASSDLVEGTAAFDAAVAAARELARTF